MPHAPSSFRHVFRLVSLAALLLGPRTAQAQSRDVPYRPEHARTAKTPVSLPLCSDGFSSTLPPRDRFERAKADIPSDHELLVLQSQQAIAFADLDERFLRPAVAMEAPTGSLFAKVLPGFSLKVAVTTSEEGPRARLVKARGPVRAAFPWKSAGEFRSFVDNHREWFGIPADRRIRALLDGNEVFLSYPNGATSFGYVRYEKGAGCNDDPRVLVCFCKPSPAVLENTLPPFDPSTLEAPVLDGEEALARFRDVAPYVSLLPTQSTRQGPLLATNLVVIQLRSGESRLVWQVRYRYACTVWSRVSQEGNREWSAYVDAKSGIVHFPYVPTRPEG
jgi:hypothetical protein